MGITKFMVKLAKPLVERFPHLAMGYRYGRDHKPLFDEAKSTPNGFKLMGNPVMESGAFEPVETRLVKELVKKCDVFINVGANIGYYICHALSGGKKAIAFEPMELNQKYLYKNIKSNGWENLAEVYPIALSGQSGLMEIYGAGTAASLVKGWAGATSNPTVVPVARFDDVLGARFHNQQCFILIDIEGAERFMLEGAAGFIERSPKPIWLIEICICEHQPAGLKVNPHLVQTFDMFWNRGYEVWTADKDLRIVSRDEIEKIANTAKDTLGTHNFIFIEAGQKQRFL